MADTDDLDLMAGIEQAGYSLCQGFDGAGRCLLHQNIAADTVFKGKDHQIHSLIQRHDETGHGRFGNGDGISCLDLIEPQGDDAAAGTHNIAVAGAADLGNLRGNSTGLGNDNLFHHCLGSTHGIDRISSLISGQADDCLHACINGSGQHIVRTDDIGLDCFHGEELTGRNLLQGGSVEDIVHTVHGTLYGSQIPHVADKELNLTGSLGHFGLKLVAHIVLLLFIAGEHTDFLNIRIEKTVQHGIAERTGTTGNHQSLVLKNAHLYRSCFHLPFPGSVIIYLYTVSLQRSFQHSKELFFPEILLIIAAGIFAAARSHFIIVCHLSDGFCQLCGIFRLAAYAA